MAQKHQSRDIPQQVREEPHQLTPDQLLPVQHRIRIGPSNLRLVPSKFTCNHPIIVEILKNHPIFPALSLTTTSTIPIIYIQQFWHNIHVVEDTKPETLITTVDQYTFDITVDFFRTVLRLPTATHNCQRGFEITPDSLQLVDFLLQLGYDTDEGKLNRCSDFRRKYLPSRWATLFSILNRSLTGKEFGSDIGRFTLYQIMYGIVNRCHFDFALLIWDELVDLVVGKKNESKRKGGKYIPFVRYIKLIIQALMDKQHISARPDEPTYEDKLMHTIQTDAKVLSNKLGMDIPQNLLDLADKTTNVYKEFVKVAGFPMESSKWSRRAPRTHKVGESSAKLGTSKGRKIKLVMKQNKKVDVKGKEHVLNRIHEVGEETLDTETENLFKDIDEYADEMDTEKTDKGEEEEAFRQDKGEDKEASEPYKEDSEKTVPVSDAANNLDAPMYEGTEDAANNFESSEDDEGGDKGVKRVVINGVKREVVCLESLEKETENSMNQSKRGVSEKLDRLESLEMRIVGITNKLEENVNERMNKNSEGNFNERMDRVEKILVNIESKQEMMSKNQTTIIAEQKEQSDKLTKIESMLAGPHRSNVESSGSLNVDTGSIEAGQERFRMLNTSKKRLADEIPIRPHVSSVQSPSAVNYVDQINMTNVGRDGLENGTFNRGESLITSSKNLENGMALLGKKKKQPQEKYSETYKNSLDDVLADTQGTPGKYHFSTAPTIQDEDLSHMQSEEATIGNIMKHENSAAAVFCELKHHHNLSVHVKDVIGVVATLGKVNDDNLSRRLAEYLGLDNMLALVCMTSDDVESLVSYDKEGLINKSSGLYGLATTIGQKIGGQFNLICLENLRPYAGEFMPNDPQKRLKISEPLLPNGETPTGFIGFAVNMIHIESAHLFYLTTDGNGLRETLFYTLLSSLQVYRTRSEMIQALPCICDGAISLDGGMIRGSGVYVVGTREAIDVKFPATSGAYIEAEKEMKLKRKRERMLEDIQKEEAMLAYIKHNYEVKKKKLLDLMEQSSP